MIKKSDTKKFISRYSIQVNNKWVKHNISNWRNALAHARNYQNDMFEEIKSINILNIWTGEIITLEEAEKRAAKFAKQSQ